MSWYRMVTQKRSAAVLFMKSGLTHTNDYGSALLPLNYMLGVCTLFAAFLPCLQNRGQIFGNYSNAWQHQYDETTDERASSAWCNQVSIASQPMHSYQRN